MSVFSKTGLNIPASLPVNHLSLKRNFTWVLGGNITYAACQWGMLIVLAKLGSSEMLGIFALGLAICAPVFFFFNLALRDLQATDANQEYSFGHYLGLRLITSVLSLLVIVIIVVVVNKIHLNINVLKEDA